MQFTNKGTLWLHVPPIAVIYKNVSWYFVVVIFVSLFWLIDLQILLGIFFILVALLFTIALFISK